MTTVRAVAQGALVWAALAASPARADSVTVASSPGAWTFYVTGWDDSGLRSELTSYFKKLAPGIPAPAPTPEPPAPVVAPPAPVVAPPAPAPAPNPPVFATPAPAAPSPTLAAISSVPVAPAASGSLVTLPSISSAPVSAADTTQNPGASQSHPATADAFLNFTGSGYKEASQLVTGTPQAWYTSPAVVKAFGGSVPTADQQAKFTSDVLSHVQTTFAETGLHPSLTLDPSAPANHTLSIVSNASYGPNGNAIGITDVGQNGFGFIDKLSFGSTPEQLAWAVAHNVSHELMHAFGVGTHPDTTGQYIDAGTASWDLLTSPNAEFSAAATSLIQNTSFGNVSSSSPALGGGLQTINPDGEQEIMAPVPEPATLAAWSAVVAGAVFGRRYRSGRRAV